MSKIINGNVNEQEERHAEARADPRYVEARDILFNAMHAVFRSKEVTEVNSDGVATNDDNTKSFLFEIVVNDMVTYGQLKELDKLGVLLSVIMPKQNGIMTLMVWVDLK